jgi:hypothetical protein
MSFLRGDEAAALKLVPSAWRCNAITPPMAVAAEALFGACYAVQHSGGTRRAFRISMVQHYRGKVRAKEGQCRQRGTRLCIMHRKCGKPSGGAEKSGWVGDGLGYGEMSVPEVATASVSTLRQRFWKVGAVVRTGIRRVGFHFSQTWPYGALWCQVLSSVNAFVRLVTSG